MTSCSWSGEMWCILEWEFQKSLQVFRDEMGIRRNGNLGVDFVTFGPKMGSHFIANALYIVAKLEGETTITKSLDDGLVAAIHHSDSYKAQK